MATEATEAIGGDIGRKHDSLTVSRRRDDIEQRIRTGSWSRRMARSLSVEYGVTVRQIYRDREAVIDAWSRNLGIEDRTREAARLLEEVRALRAATAAKGLAAVDGSLLRSAVALLSLEADLLRLRDPIRLDVRMSRDEPIALAREVAGLLPFVSEILDLDLGPEVVDALAVSSGSTPEIAPTVAPHGLDAALPTP